MAHSIIPTDFFSEVFQGVHALPMKGFAIAAGVGGLNIAIDLLFRNVGGHYSAPEYAIGLALIVVSLISLYLIAMIMVQVPATWAGGLRFLSTLILTIGFPLGALLAGLWLLRGTGGGAAAVLILVALLPILIAVPLLSAWPIAQAMSRRFVSPMRILRATKGHRWGLISASYLSTAINKFLPAATTAHSSGQATLLAIGNGAVSCASIVLLASIAATAWQFAVRQSPDLAAGVDH